MIIYFMNLEEVFKNSPSVIQQECHILGDLNAYVLSTSSQGAVGGDMTAFP